MRVAAFVIAAVLMAAPVALAQTEVTPPEAVAEAATQESVTAPTDEEATAPAATESEAPVATPAPSEERVCRSGAVGAACAAPASLPPAAEWTRWTVPSGGTKRLIWERADVG